jgi:hypothetical protein
VSFAVAVAVMVMARYSGQKIGPKLGLDNSKASSDLSMLPYMYTYIIDEI